MKLLVTGAWGIVGRETVRELLAAGHQVQAFDLDTSANRRQFKQLSRQVSKDQRDRLAMTWGNLTDLRAVIGLCRDIDGLIHLAALIPPAADKQPLEAFYVNVAATELLIHSLERSNPRAVVVFTSSISVYGDRRRNPLIAVDDPLNPNAHDWYGRQKVLAEGLVRNSTLAWCILRLTYIVSPFKLHMDPLMFAMPLDTSIEICHARDVAFALRQAAEKLGAGGLAGTTLAIAGGVTCRTSYREYLQAMFALFGLGKGRRLPEELWSSAAFHCGFMDTRQSQALLGYQHVSLADYYAEVGQVCRARRFLISLVRPVAWAWLLGQAPLMSKVSAVKVPLQAHLTALMAAMSRFIANQRRYREGRAAEDPGL